MGGPPPDLLAAELLFAAHRAGCECQPVVWIGSAGVTLAHQAGCPLASLEDLERELDSNRRAGGKRARTGRREGKRSGRRKDRLH